MSQTAVEVLSREHADLRHLFGRLSDLDADRKAIWTEIVKQIATHVAVERTHIYPLIRRRRLGPQDRAATLRNDYTGMEHLLVLTERRKLNSPDLPRLISRLVDLFDAHKDRCATVVTPALAQSLTPQELRDLGALRAPSSGRPARLDPGVSANPSHRAGISVVAARSANPTSGSASR